MGEYKKVCIRNPNAEAKVRKLRAASATDVQMASRLPWPENAGFVEPEVGLDAPQSFFFPSLFATQMTKEVAENERKMSRVETAVYIRWQDEWKRCAITGNVKQMRVRTRRFGGRIKRAEPPQ